MSMGTYSLKLDHPDLTTEEVVFSNSEVTLRLLGRDHHRAATLKPELTLKDPTGNILARMDEWADDWTEASE